jgi:hypothetical protein
LNSAAVGNSGGGGDAVGRGDSRALLHARLPDPLRCAPQSARCATPGSTPTCRRRSFTACRWCPRCGAFPPTTPANILPRWPLVTGAGHGACLNGIANSSLAASGNLPAWSAPRSAQYRCRRCRRGRQRFFPSPILPSTVSCCRGPNRNWLGKPMRTLVACAARGQTQIHVQNPTATTVLPIQPARPGANFGLIDHRRTVADLRIAAPAPAGYEAPARSPRPRPRRCDRRLESAALRGKRQPAASVCNSEQWSPRRAAPQPAQAAAAIPQEAAPRTGQRQCRELGVGACCANPASAGARLLPCLWPKAWASTASCDIG